MRCTWSSASTISPLTYPFLHCNLLSSLLSPQTKPPPPINSPPNPSFDDPYFIKAQHLPKSRLPAPTLLVGLNPTSINTPLPLSLTLVLSSLSYLSHISLVFQLTMSLSDHNYGLKTTTIWSRPDCRPFFHWSDKISSPFLLFYLFFVWSSPTLLFLFSFFFWVWLSADEWVLGCGIKWEVR